MPEDLEDKLDDFELMLEGFCRMAAEGAPGTNYSSRLLAYYSDLSGEIAEVLKKARKK